MNIKMNTMWPDVLHCLIDDTPFPPELKNQLEAHCRKEIDKKIVAMKKPTSKINQQRALINFVHAVAKRMVDLDKKEISIEDAVLSIPDDVKQQLEASGRNVDSVEGLRRLYYRNEALMCVNIKAMRAEVRRVRPKLRELERLEKELIEAERPWREKFEEYERQQEKQ